MPTQTSAPASYAPSSTVRLPAGPRDNRSAQYKEFAALAFVWALFGVVMTIALTS